MSKWRTFRPFTYRGRTYHWRTDGSRWELFMADRVVAKVVADVVYPKMWSIDLGDGTLSDMINLSRAKDAARRLVDASLDATKTLRRASPMRQTDPAASSGTPRT
jgi:hypothetical protein